MGAEVADDRVPPALRGRTELSCQVREVLDRIGERWSLAVLAELGPGTRRFGELRRSVPGISQRMLTSTVRTLERDGLVRRTVHPTVPPRVDYDLTELGRALLTTALPLLGWALDNAAAIGRARAEYDGRAAGGTAQSAAVTQRAARPAGTGCAAEQ